jgi:hypothetical protein
MGAVDEARTETDFACGFIDFVIKATETWEPVGGGNLSQYCNLVEQFVGEMKELFVHFFRTYSYYFLQSQINMNSYHQDIIISS